MISLDIAGNGKWYNVFKHVHVNFTALLSTVQYYTVRYTNKPYR